MQKHTRRKGFTLIELVIVIAIIGILAGLAIPRMMDATATAKGAKIVADLRTIDSALTIYYAKTGSYIQINPFGDSTKLTTDDPANNKYALLAKFPTPPTGNVIFPCNPNYTVTIQPGHVAYVCSASLGRAQVIINSSAHIYSVERLAEGGDAY